MRWMPSIGLAPFRSPANRQAACRTVSDAGWRSRAPSRSSLNFLLLDEPAGGLTDAEQSDLATRLRRLAAEGTTLMIIEHNMSFLMPLAARMACLEGGRLIALGTPAEVRTNIRVIEAYLGGGTET